MKHCGDTWPLMKTWLLHVVAVLKCFRISIKVQIQVAHHIFAGLSFRV